MNPIWKKTPVRATSFSMAAVSGRVRAGGFSQNVGLPAWSDAMAMGRWVWVGLTMTTASTSPSCRSASGSG
jgi:hypothetical protein